MPNGGMCARTEAAQQPLLKESFRCTGTVAGVICPPSGSLSPMSVPLFPMGGIGVGWQGLMELAA